MNQQSRLMVAKDWCFENYLDFATLSIMQVGSSVYKEDHEINDVDILIIKDGMEVNYTREKHELINVTVDALIIDSNHFVELMESPPTDFQTIRDLSLFLVCLRKGRIWYQRYLFLEGYVKLAKNWQWDPNLKKLLNFKLKEPKKEWAKNAYFEHLQILEIIKRRLDTGEPISHRRKEMPDVWVQVDEIKARSLFEKTKIVYEKMAISNEWTEWGDAKKAIELEDWIKAFYSMKDVLRWILRKVISNPPSELFDPTLWSIADKTKLPKELLAALEEAYLFNL
ncbi:MAG: hypothetical protein ACTSYA_10930 [Candidatus Kariarchaeaceae archaeon]